MLAAALLLARSVRAADDLVIPLKFVPTTKPGHVQAELRDGISSKPVAIAIEDARAVKSKDIVGEGTGSGDQTFRIRSAGYMPVFLKTTLTDRFSTWGVQVSDAADLVLLVRVTRYYAHEAHGFMNSTFTGEVQLPWVLQDRAGHVYAEGTALGTGHTKGRWRNPVNCEEVLSDALELAAAAVLRDGGLQEAWLTASPEHLTAVAAERSGAPQSKVVMQSTPMGHAAHRSVDTSPHTPSQLLTQVKKLRQQQMGTDLLVAYVSKQDLTVAFTADDLVAWKAAGVPETVVREAVKRAP